MGKNFRHKLMLWTLLAAITVMYAIPPFSSNDAIPALAAGEEESFFEALFGETKEEADENDADNVSADMGSANEFDLSEKLMNETASVATQIRNEIERVQNDARIDAMIAGISEEDKAAAGSSIRAVDNFRTKPVIGNEYERAALIEDAGSDEVNMDELMLMTLERKEALTKAEITDVPETLTMNFNAKYDMRLTKDEITILERIVEAEAGGEDAFGKILVANVVLNRVLDEEFPETVEEVVFQHKGNKYQFSPVKPGHRYYTVEVSQDTKQAVARALKGEDYSKGALYFIERKYTSSSKASWFDRSLRKVVKYGCHEFFANK